MTGLKDLFRKMPGAREIRNSAPFVLDHLRYKKGVGFTSFSFFLCESCSQKKTKQKTKYVCRRDWMRNCFALKESTVSFSIRVCLSSLLSSFCAAVFLPILPLRLPHRRLRVTDRQKSSQPTSTAAIWLPSSLVSPPLLLESLQRAEVTYIV